MGRLVSYSLGDWFCNRLCTNATLFQENYPNGKPQIINIWRLALALFLVGLSPDSWKEVASLNLSEWGWLALASFVGPVAGRIIYTYALQFIPISHAVLYTTLIPVSTLIGEIIFLEHWLEIHEFLGVLYYLRHPFALGLASTTKFND